MGEIAAAAESVRSMGDLRFVVARSPPCSIVEAHGFLFSRNRHSGGGRTISAFLAEVGLLRPVVLDVICRRFDPAAFRSAALIKLSGLAQALLAQSSRISKSRITERLELLQQAAWIAPANPIVLSRLGIELAWSVV